MSINTNSLVKIDLQENTILIVDDEQANLKVLSDYFKDSGLKVLFARNGKDGIEKACFSKPDLILLDVLLPGMDGYETCRQLKQNEATRDIPIIFMTVLSGPEDKLNGFDAGGVDYIPKPFQHQEVLARVITHLQLRGLSKYLEQMVKERTKKLELSNQKLKREIAERKRAEEEKEKLQSQLLQAQKMESVGRLAGGVAHDFNNMLSVILGHAELTLSQLHPTHLLYSSIKEIHKAARRSADLTRQLLTFARKQIALPKVLDLNDTLTGMLSMLRRLIGEDIDLAWKPGTELWPVKIDPSQVDQMLANLCINARDAIAKVGKIVIETSNIKFDDAYCHDHPDFSPGEYIMLAVSDNGCGMTNEIIANIFEPFFTTKPLGEGTGLGLASVHGIVKQNMGFIHVYSEPKEGSTFKIYLPRHIGKIDQISAPGPEIDIAGNQEVILLVEDDPAVLDLSMAMLERLGYQVLTAVKPTDAIQLAQKYTGEINLLITDVVMPEMNGQELAEHLLQHYPNLKQLFVSGYTSNVISHRGMLKEGVYFLQKPFSIRELGVRIREVLQGE